MAGKDTVESNKAHTNNVTAATENLEGTYPAESEAWSPETLVGEPPEEGGIHEFGGSTAPQDTDKAAQDISPDASAR